MAARAERGALAAASIPRNKTLVRQWRRKDVESMKLKRSLVPALALGLLATVSLSSTAAAQQTVTVNLGPGRNEATATGTATITDLGGGMTRVVINVTPTYPNMPAHFHADPCPGVAAVVFPLTNVMNGTSTTEINASWAEIQSRSRSINLHKGPPPDIDVYTGCGNLPTVAAPPAAAPAPAAAAPARAPAQMPRTGDLAFVAPLLGAAGAGLAGLGLALRRRRGR
jgi:hypothetical protein